MWRDSPDAICAVVAMTDDLSCCTASAVDAVALVVVAVVGASEFRQFSWDGTSA